MPSYHIAAQGPMRCRATKKPCPYAEAGGSHYSNKADAVVAYDEQLKTTYATLTSQRRGWRTRQLSGLTLSEFDASKVLKRNSKRIGVVGLILASATMVSACGSVEFDGSNNPARTQAETYSPTGNYVDIVPTEASEVPPQAAKPTAAPSKIKLPKVTSEDLNAAKDRLKNSVDEANSALAKTYGRDWKEKLIDSLTDYESYLPSIIYAGSTLDEKSSSGTGYDRAKFKHWVDTDLYNNSCDTRQDILQRDMKNVVLGRDGCTVMAGTLHDPYTNTDIVYKKGSLAIDIDHIVPLKDAWEAGASGWSDSKRQAFANDPANLLAVQAGANRSKSDRSPATWMPLNHAYACTYGETYLKLVKKYGLTMKAADLASVNKACA